jgi:hypothetical protein
MQHTSALCQIEPTTAACANAHIGRVQRREKKQKRVTADTVFAQWHHNKSRFLISHQTECDWLELVIMAMQPARIACSPNIVYVD